MPRAAAALLFLFWVCAPCAAQSDAVASTESRLPPNIQVDVGGEYKIDPNGDHVLTGGVTILWRNSRIQADRISLSDGRYVEADGNVLIVWDDNRIFGNRMTYDLETERGVLERASGQVRGGFTFRAKTVEKIGDELIRLKSGTVSTCTQPTPYWSFSVTSATIRIDHYARMWNVLFKTYKVPIIYLPYVMWPVKRDRAAGLLMPEFNSTQERGRAITLPLFIPLGKSADLTLIGRHYSEAGFGGGGVLRFIPNLRGAASLDAFYIKDEALEEPEGRYRATYNQTQSFKNGFRMVADLNFVSDFDYFTDFERDLDLVSSPTILARLEFSRNGPWTSINVRELSRDQLFSSGDSLLQQTLPEIEWRGRSKKLGRSPLYLTYESSLASIRQEGVQAGREIDADYLRGDIFPTLSMPLSKLPWLELTPRVSYRMTHYTQRQTPNGVILDKDLSRTLWGAGLEMIGPKIVRIFDRPKKENAPKYKHLIEPRLAYGYFATFDRTGEIILYDEVDRFSGAGNQVNYGIVQRLFAQRPRSVPSMGPAADQTIMFPDGTTSQPSSGELMQSFSQGFVLPEVDLSQDREPVEIASFELRQGHSFDRYLSSADLDRDGIDETRSRFSSVTMIGRYNPYPSTSIDVRGDYHVLYNKFSTINVSGGLRNQIARLRFSIVHRNGLRVRDVPGMKLPEPVDDETQLRLTTGLKFFRGRLLLDLDGSINFDPPEGQSAVPDRRWRVQYSTQCCTFLVEQVIRDFGSTTRDDLYFRVDLTGIGQILRYTYE